MEKIKVRIIFKEYLKLLFGLTYRKPIMIVILFVDLIMITWITLFVLRLNGIPGVTYFQFTTVALITFIQPAVIYNTIRKNYQSAAHLKEKLEMEFTRNLLKIQGESFYTELMWVKTFRVRELKKWFLIYQNNLSAIIIPKKAFTKHQQSEFRDFLKNIPELELHLLNKNK